MHLFLHKRLYFVFALLYLLLASPERLWAQACTAPTITTDKTSICSGESTTLLLSPEPTYPVTSYQWFVDEDGDGVFTAVPGATSKSQAVGTAGVYQLQITSSDCGPQVSNNIRVNVTDRPSTPVISVNPASGAICGGDQVTFTVQSPEAGVDYIWRVDGSNPKSGTQVMYTFESFGVGSDFFTVSVEAIRQPGSCRTLEDITVEVRQTPVIDFSEENDFTVCLEDSINPADTTVVAKLVNNIQEPYLSNIAAYFIDWGDGNGEQRYPGDPSLFPEEGPEYTDFGSYPIKVRVESNNGCEATFEREFFYGKNPKANFTTNKEAVGTPQSCTPVIWSFGDSTTVGDGLSDDLTYKWEIMDQMNIGGWEVQLGETLTEDTLRVQFNNSGVFEVQLIVSNSCSSDTTSQSIIVGYPQAQLGGSITACGDTTIRYDQTTVFFDPNFGNTVSYEWFVNGQQVSRQQYPTLRFDDPGTYNVEVRITNECGTSDDLGQQQPPQVITILPVPGPPVISNVTTCSGDSALLAPTGPGTSYNFYDNRGNLVFTGASYKTPPLTGATTFRVETIDSNNCPSDMVTVFVGVVPAIGNNTIIGAQSICVGDAPAELTGSQPSGGAGGSYVYTWQISTTGPASGFTKATGTSNSQNYKPESIGQTSWFRRVVNSGSCTADTSAAVQVTVVPRIENNTISEDQEICADDMPATLVGERPTGGDGTNYNIIWEVSTAGPDNGFVPASGSNAGENYDPDMLTQTSWFRRVVESGGCRVTSEPVVITVYDALANNTISIEEDETCTGTAPGVITGSEPTGGSGSYTYTWQSSTAGPNAGFTAATGTNNGQSYSPGRLGRTTWFRRIVGSEACSADTSAVLVITVSPAVRNNTIVASQATVCTGQAPNPITGSMPTDGAGGYTYLWQSSTISATAGFVQASGTNDGQNYTPQALNRNTWFRRVVFSGGCSDTSNVVSITVLPIPATPTVAVSNATACLNGSVTLSVANPNGSEYRWYTSSTGGSPVFIGAEYTIDNVTQSATYYVEAVNAQECASASRAPATVTVVTVEASAGPDKTVIQGQTVELRGTGGATYQWEPATYLNNPNIANPIARPEETITYTVTVTSREGCVDTASVTVEVIPGIKIPNAFTPNGDNVNEVWEIENFENYPDMRVEVFNRWGNKIFSSKGYGVPWDGTYNGKELPVATYYYLIYLERISDEPISGNVTIIR
ncbi:Ig-like domain-containing protein [Pontibacter oryzae]|uniref:PKD domain-containing protein n=1 Tax=Pontibacter oryzae TaxID=2304593 RepID=A0A399S466_9BACT|nr:gliding motility-associated C-terminal domain-containing protein [Pontibacter oryzae]RIJ37544.1 hypothetical protein D1627_10535 [Pontibacter oryzae]